MEPPQIAIIGSRGIPNFYGGFEQFAAFLAPALVEKGFKVTVYCSTTHPLRMKTYEGVKLVYIWDPVRWLGGGSQFLYDLLTILHCRKQSYHLIYQLGYTTSGLWQWLMPSASLLMSNMDGMEWTRSKYRGLVKQFLKISENLVANRSHHLIADAAPIRSYYLENYSKSVTFIPYATQPKVNIQQSLIEGYGLMPFQYFLVIARMQPDNHIEWAIQSVIQSGTTKTLIIVGNIQNTYGRYLEKKYGTHPSIRFLGALFDQDTLNALRHYSALYIHGHSAGGTNPSLLEAIAADARIAAHDNVYNRSVCQNGAVYFGSVQELADLISHAQIESNQWEDRINIGRTRLMAHYTPEVIADQYIQLIHQLLPKE
jgi:glycosyltransferase involved in cell wall biosynthesis